MKIGDRVKYARHFLRDVGLYTGPLPHATGTITALDDLSPGCTLARVDWDTEGCPNRTNAKNLVLASRVHLEAP